MPRNFPQPPLQYLFFTIEKALKLSKNILRPQSLAQSLLKAQTLQFGSAGTEGLKVFKAIKSRFMLFNRKFRSHNRIVNLLIWS